jgi:hypothetical protein
LEAPRRRIATQCGNFHSTSSVARTGLLRIIEPRIRRNRNGFGHLRGQRGRQPEQPYPLGVNDELLPSRWCVEGLMQTLRIEPKWDPRKCERRKFNGTTGRAQS